jgi:hypothetical protein
VALGLDVRPKEIVIGDADALEGRDQQSDDVGYDQFVLSLRQPVAVQFPALLVVFEARPQLGDHGCEIIG